MASKKELPRCVSNSVCAESVKKSVLVADTPPLPHLNVGPQELKKGV